MPLTRRNHVLAQAHSPGKWLWFNFLAIIAGALGGLGALGLRLLVQGLEWVFSFLRFPAGDVRLGDLFIPMIGAFCFTWITTRKVPETRGSGMPEIIQAAALDRGRVKPAFGPAKLLATGLTVASGASAGTEGPVAVIGASFASLLGRGAKLNPFEVRILMACGIAGAVAGTFNTPFGGALFAMEVVFRGIGIFSIIPAFLASVMGSVVVSMVLGSEAAFPVAIEWPALGIEAYIVFLAFGAIFGLIAYGWVKIMYHAQRLYAGLKITSWKVPVFGAVITGGVIFFLPGLGISGTGYDGIALMLDGSVSTWWVLLAMGLVKMFATANTLSSGGSGGVFGPSLYIGCAFGGLLGVVICNLLPGLGLSPELFALVGMGALFAGAAQAPIHIIVMIAEITRNFSVVPPLIIAASSCFVISWMLLRGSSIYTAKLEARGINLGNESFFLLQNVSVGDVMTRKPMKVRASATLAELTAIVGAEPFKILPVVDDEGKHAGVVTRANCKDPASGMDCLVASIVDTSYPVIDERDVVQQAMDVMVEKGVGALPVASKESDATTIVGVITEKDVKRLFGTRR